MTATNRELFTTDPTSTKIPNDGIATVARPETDQQWKVLTWELQSFVCEGEYARGLERILNSFLTNVSQAKQPAVWVSGFYGQRQVAPRSGAGVPLARHRHAERRECPEPGEPA